MIDFLNKYGRNIFASQNGEEGVLIEVYRRLWRREGFSVEFGGHNGHFCSNTAYLLQHGWSGLFIEASFELHKESCANWPGDNVDSVCAMVTADNVNLFVDERCNLLSIDTDGDDFNIFGALEARPEVVIVEIDSSIPPDRSEFNRDGGAGYLPMLLLGLSKGYFLLCHTGNLVLVRHDFRRLFPEIKGDGVENSEAYFKRDWLQ